MRTLKKFAVLAVAVFAISVVGVASASAAQFTSSTETGNLEGSALNTQEFTTNGGVVKCTAAKTTGAFKGTAMGSVFGSSTQEVTVNYSGCTAFGFASVSISPATYEFTPTTKQVHILNTITISVPLGGCTVTVPPTKTALSEVSFENAGTSNIKEISNVTGITYTSSGGLCGSSGSNGIYKGNNEVHATNGATLRFDA